MYEYDKMATTDDKIDALLRSVDALKQLQKENQEAMARKLSQLENEVAAGQDSAAQRACKKMKLERVPEFKKKGHERQYAFIKGVKDHVDAASQILSKLKPADDREEATVKAAMEELDQGMKALLARQKLIRIADRSELGWQVIDAYESDELASGDEDAKRLEKAEKVAEQKAERRRKKWTLKTAENRAMRRGSQYSRDLGMQQGPSKSYPTPGPAGQLPQMPRRIPGPCFNCLEMGHLKGSCPKLNKPYPLNTSKEEGVNCYVDVVSQEIVPTKVCGNEQGCVNEYRESGEADASFDSIAWKVCGEIPSVGECGSSGVMENDPSFGRVWEVGQEEGQVCDVQGRLCKCITFWEQELKATAPVLDWIRVGYKLPLLTEPGAYHRANAKSALINSEFVTKAITELEENRCIRKVKERPQVCSPLSVVANSKGKKRLVLDLRYLNQFLLKEKFKYEDLRTAMLMFERGDLLVTFDLKSGYHHVDIHEKHWTYLGFEWQIDSKSQYYVFTVLPFGLATACYVFTKLLRPLVRYWRRQGIRVIIYIDDGVVAEKGRPKAELTSIKVQDDLRKAGFITNSSKCNWKPSKCGAWLGFDIDLEQGCVLIPQDKITDLQVRIKQVVERAHVGAKQLASIIGKIVSMSLALGPVARLMTRNLYALLNTRAAWCHELRITSDALMEFQFWNQEIEKFNGQNIWQTPSAIRVVYTDASDTGYGGYTVEHGCQIAQGQWAATEAVRSSTWRELRAVRLVLESLVSKLANERVHWFTDNQNVSRILLVGSRTAELQEEAFAIFSVAIANRINIEPEWIPRIKNQQADYLSRLIDHDDWKLDPNAFAALEQDWGPHSVDRFATFYNAQLPRFNSRFWNPGAEAMDAFTCDWHGEANWWCPPPYLIPRTIKHAQRTRACGTLIVPQWVSVPFWPILFPDGYTNAGFIREIRVLDNVIILPGRHGANLFDNSPTTNMLALKVNFSN